MKRVQQCFIVLLLLLSFLPGAGQPIKERLAAYKEWPRYKAIDQFYQQTNYSFAWIGNEELQHNLLATLHSADSFGLEEVDYLGAIIKEYKPGQPLYTKNDSTEADILLTDAAIHFFTELKTGNKPPSFRYSGLSYNSDTGAIPLLLWQTMQQGNFQSMVSSLQPASQEYRAVLQKLNRLQRVKSEPGFREVKLVSARVDSNNEPLLWKLYQLGFTDTLVTSIPTKDLQQKLREMQRSFDVLSDGILRSTSRAAFNIPVSRRIIELKKALNVIRWIATIRQSGSVLVLNIPSAYLLVYQNDSILLDSKVIVGKPSTPTPALSSKITEVILYPYWMVPNKIATGELLPLIKRDIGYLEDGGYQVLSKSGKVLNPYSINWHRLSAGYFPYIIRQSTGCDNSLGIVKFNFDNPFAVYLHDTPTKYLFSFSKRYFSHGCMRVEKPVELARLLLGSNRIAIDTLTEKGCINYQSPIPVPIEPMLPIAIVYSTVWYTKEGEVRFYDDVYGKLN